MEANVIHILLCFTVCVNEIFDSQNEIITTQFPKHPTQFPNSEILQKLVCLSPLEPLSQNRVGKKILYQIFQFFKVNTSMKILEILNEGWDFNVDGAWIHTSGKVVNTDGQPHASALFNDPQGFGLANSDLSPYMSVGDVDELQELINSEDPDEWDRGHQMLTIVGEENDGEWSPLYRLMYSRGWLRAFKADDEGSFAGNASDFAKLFQKGTIQKWVSTVNGNIHLSLSFGGGKPRETSIAYRRGGVGDFINGVKSFLG
jgi:hypothetical protein